MRTLLALTLVAATFCFALGITLPLIEMKRLFFRVDEPSLLMIVLGLWRSSDWLLAVVIGLFSVAFPAVKLAYLHVLALGGAPARLQGAMRVMANWSMLDVMLVALVIFAAQTSGLAAASARPGIWFFAASIALTALASAIAKKLHEN